MAGSATFDARVAFIEDKNWGTILLQQASRRQMPAPTSSLTAMGKDERTISVSGYVHRELVKYMDRAFEKTVIYKRHSRNHLLDQVESFRVGIETATARTTYLIPFATASRWRSGIAKASSPSLLSNDRRAVAASLPRASWFESPRAPPSSRRKPQWFPGLENPWDALNANLPVGLTSTDNSSKNITAR